MPEEDFRRYLVVFKFALPFFLFFVFFTPDILNPTRIGWLMGGDWGQHFLGWHAYRAEPLHWPFNRENLLNHPTGLTLIYTDSNPLLALPLRLISGLLPAHFQYIGWWFLACVLIHYYVAYRLVRRHAPGPWVAIAGATLLSLLPTLYNRIGHDTLCAHWLILWGLFVFFEIPDERQKRIWYATLLGVAGLIHPYLLFMVLAIWGADQLRWFGPMLKARDYVGAARATGLSALSLLPAIATLAISGAFSDTSAGSDGFGIYGMPLDAFFNPGNDRFALAFWHGPQEPRMAFEGFQYLGAGLLFLIGAAIYLYRRSPEVKTADSVLNLARPLKWPFIVLLALAISDHIWLYKIKILDLSFPNFMVQWLNVVRASGRLFWPIAYTLVFLSLICVYRARARTTGIVLSAAMVLQVIDIGPFAAFIKAHSVPAAQATPYQKVTSPQWDQLMAQADLVSMMPGVPVIADHRTYYEIILRGVDHKVPVDMMYSARQNTTQDALLQEAYYSFLEGRIDPRHLYVLRGQGVPAGLESRVRRLDGVWIIPPQNLASSLTDIPAVPAFELGKTYTFGAELPTAVWANRTWSMPEESSLSTLHDKATITLPYTPEAGKDYVLALDLRARFKGEHLKVAVDDAVLADVPLTKKAQQVVVNIPAIALKPGPLRLSFQTRSDKPAKPGQAARVGMQLYGVKLERR